mmetsp:Transcript_50833/g.111288  ORF Transcript_50833/g.111288 Transcript_50833/m.111288 type:complete len:287 (+) Transcript_50833:2816-3676(+)
MGTVGWCPGEDRIKDSSKVVVAGSWFFPRQFRATATPSKALDLTLGTASLHRPTSAFTILATDAGSPASESKCRCSRIDKESSAASTRNPTRSHRSICSRKFVKRSNRPRRSAKSSGLICSLVAASTMIFTTVSAPTCLHSARSGVRMQMCCSKANAGSESLRGMVSGGGGGMLLALGSSVWLVGGAITSSSCPANSTGRSRKTLVVKASALACLVIACLAMEVFPESFSASARAGTIHFSTWDARTWGSPCRSSIILNKETVADWPAASSTGASTISASRSTRAP